MPTRELIAVTGATGAVGSRVAAALAGHAVRQRLVVRDAARAPAIDGAEVRVASSYGAREEMHEALTGASTLFLIPGGGSADREDQHEAVVDAAVAAGVERFVYVSFVGAAPDATFTLAREHWTTEELIRATGRPFTFLRMNFYTDFLPKLVNPDGAIRGPAGEGRLSSVTRDDVAASAVAVLTSADHDGRTYDLTGPESLTLAEIAERMARSTGRAIRFENETDEEAYASRADLGVPRWELEAYVSTYHAIRDGSLGHVSHDVATLTGRDAQTLDDLLAGDPACMDHVH